MTKLNQTGKLAVLAVVVVVIVALVVIYGGGQSGTPAPTASSTPSAASPSAPSGQSGGSTANTTGGSGNTAGSGGTAKSGGTTGAPNPQQAITFVTPVPGDTWTIGASNEIQWSREAGVNGTIELLDASTFRLVGVILNVAGPHQTYYTWNTRDLFQSATNPLKFIVTPGRYVIRIVWSGNNVPTITSQPITISQ